MRPCRTVATSSRPTAPPGMAAYCLNMLTIALELAGQDNVYEDIATKFFEHFLRIAAAVADISDDGIALWDPQDGSSTTPCTSPMGGACSCACARSWGSCRCSPSALSNPTCWSACPPSAGGLEWFLSNRPYLAGHIAEVDRPGVRRHRLFSILTRERLERVLARMLDESEFLSDYGVRSLSKYHEDHPYCLDLGGEEHIVTYQPAESRTGIFGGNSNWRGPIWFPVNYLIIESLLKFNHYYGDSLQIEFPTGSGRRLTLEQVADQLAHRLMRIFCRDPKGSARSTAATRCSRTIPSGATTFCSTSTSTAIRAGPRRRAPDGLDWPRRHVAAGTQ